MKHVDDSISTEDAVKVFDVLGHPVRNCALRVLRQQETPIPVVRLASLLVRADATDRGPASGPATEREAESELHHVHLPKLDDAGVVRYDQDEQVVTALDEERLESLLSTGQELLDSLER